MRRQYYSHTDQDFFIEDFEEMWDILELEINKRTSDHFSKGAIGSLGVSVYSTSQIRIDEGVYYVGSNRVIIPSDYINYEAPTDPSTLTPEEGDKFKIPPGAVGVWAGHTGEIAEWDSIGGAWVFSPAYILFNVDTTTNGTFYIYGDYIPNVYTRFVAQERRLIDKLHKKTGNDPLIIQSSTVITDDMPLICEVVVSGNIITDVLTDQQQISGVSVIRDDLINVGSAWSSYKIVEYVAEKLMEISSSVINEDTTNPATLTPSDGDSYIVPAAAIGVWAGHANDIAVWRSSTLSWEFATPSIGRVVYNAALNRYRSFTATGWDYQDKLFDHNMLFGRDEPGNHARLIPATDGDGVIQITRNDGTPIISVNTTPGSERVIITGAAQYDSVADMDTANMSSFASKRYVDLHGGGGGSSNIIDSVTGIMYTWGMEDGVVFLEEV